MSNKPASDHFPVGSIAQAIMLALACFLFGYTALRAATLSFTHDESLSWLWYVRIPFGDFLSFTPPSGNNHLLNSLGMRITSTLFGDSELSLRIPSLIGHLLYLSFTFLLVKQLQNPWIRVTGFMLLNLNPYLLDFFSLARGYGLSMGLLAAFFFWFFRWLKTRSPRHLIPAVIALSLATLANITISTLFIAAWITANLFTQRGMKHILSLNGIFTAAGLVTTGVLLPVVRPLLKAGKIDYGGDTGFWIDSVISLLKKSMYEMPYRHEATTVAAWILIAAFALTIFLFLLQARGRRFVPVHPLWATSAMLLLMAAGLILQFRLFGTPFLMSRTALILWPLLVLIPLFTADQYALHRALKIPVVILTITLAGAAGYHATRTLNLTHCLEWRFDADNRTMLRLLEQEAQPAENRKTRLALTWLMEPSLNYYRLSLPLPWLHPPDRSGPFVEAGFRYATPAEADSLKKLNQAVIQHFPVSGNTLFRAR